MPQEFRFDGDRVRIRRVSRGVLLEPIISDVRKWFAEMDRIKPDRGIDGEDRRAASCELRLHLKAQRFSRNSPRKSKEIVMTRIPMEIAAPSGQSGW